MENRKHDVSTEKRESESHSLTSSSASILQSTEANTDADPNPNPRTPFTSLDQVDADLALACALQEQEAAYMMLRVDGNSEPGSYVYQYDEFVEGIEGVDVHEHEHLENLDFHNYDDVEHEMMEARNYVDDAFYANNEELMPGVFENDEALARTLQDVEAWALHDVATGGGVAEHEGYILQTQDAWQDVDVNPDQLSYEELVALGDIVGTESKGLSAETIASLPLVNYKAQTSQDGNIDQCVICQLNYENGVSLVSLSCKHLYHPECINQWLQINKVCPICSREVSSSSNQQSLANL